MSSELACVIDPKMKQKEVHRLTINSCGAFQTARKNDSTDNRKRDIIFLAESILTKWVNDDPRLKNDLMFVCDGVHVNVVIKGNSVEEIKEKMGKEKQNAYNRCINTIGFAGLLDYNNIDKSIYDAYKIIQKDGHDLVNKRVLDKLKKFLARAYSDKELIVRVPRSNGDVEDGWVVNVKDGRRLNYGEVTVFNREIGKKKSIPFKVLEDYNPWLFR